MSKSYNDANYFAFETLLLSHCPEIVKSGITASLHRGAGRWNDAEVVKNLDTG